MISNPVALHRAQSPSTFRALVERNPDVVVVLDADGAIKYVSAAITRISGYQPDEVIGRSLFDFIHPDDLAAAKADFLSHETESVLATRRYRHKEGTWVPVETLTQNALHDPDVAGIIVHSRDITAQRKAEESLQRVSRALNAYTAVNAALVHARDEGELLAQVCRIMVETGGYRLAWVGYAERDDHKVVRPVAQFGPEAGYLVDAHITWDESERGRGPTGAAIREGVSQVNQNTMTNPHMKPWWQTAAKRHFGSSVAIPLKDERGAFGALSLYAQEPDAFDPQELKLLEQLVEELTFGVLALRANAAQKRGVEELRESERRFSETLANVDLISLMLDNQARITYCNDYLLHLTGWDRQEVLGRNWFDTFIPAGNLNMKTEFDRLLKGQPSALHGDSEILTRAGERRMIHWSHTLLRAPSDGVTGIATIGEDVTDLKQARENVRQIGLRKRAEKKFRDLLESAPEANVIVNLAGEVVLVNARTVELFGYDRAELLGRHLDMLMPERFRTGHPGLRDLFNAKTVARRHLMAAGLELFGLRKDGSEFPAEISLSPIETEDGMLVSSSIRDISERKEYERALFEKNSELEAINLELRTFDYSISHDLRAPIRHVEGFSAVLLEEYAGALDARGRDLLQRIQNAGRRMDELVADLLALSLVSRSELARKDVDMSALAQRVFSDLQRSDAARSVDCVVAPALTANADPGLMRIALENLIGNAWKFTGKRSAARIEFGCTLADGVPAYFVRDNGAGFDAASADRLFAPFQRLHADSDFKGTGVGLATVWRIITRHGGRIWAAGEVGKGATFYFTLGKSPGPEVPRNETVKA